MRVVREGKEGVLVVQHTLAVVVSGSSTRKEITSHARCWMLLDIKDAGDRKDARPMDEDDDEHEEEQLITSSRKPSHQQGVSRSRRHP